MYLNNESILIREVLHRNKNLLSIVNFSKKKILACKSMILYKFKLLKKYEANSYYKYDSFDLILVILVEQ